MKLRCTSQVLTESSLEPWVHPDYLADMPIAVYLVDDHPFMLEGIRSILTGHEGFSICGESADPVEALEKIPASGAELVITDHSMPGMSGAELSRRLLQKSPGIKILALSMHGDQEHIREMLDAGVSGYVLKNTSRAELLEALDRIAKGGMYFSQDAATEILKPRPVTEKQDEKPAIRLTPREIDIVRCIAQELNNAEIAEKLFISERTVETHRKNIFHKTQTKSVAGLIRFALSAGYIE